MPRPPHNGMTCTQADELTDAVVGMLGAYNQYLLNRSLDPYRATLALNNALAVGKYRMEKLAQATR